MKQRKNAFTLIELLAVIVILAIIALIATPIILNIIEKSRKSAFIDTAYGLIEAAKLQYTQGILDNDVTEKNYTFPQTGTDKLEFSGGEPSGGIIKVNSTGQVSIAIHDGTWCVMKSSADSEVTITKYEEGTCELPVEEAVKLPAGLTKGTPIYFNPELKVMCDESEAISTTGTKTGCMKWYVYKDNADGTYQLILDHNTTATVAWNSSGNNADGMNEVATALTTDTTTWHSSLQPRLITADEVADIVGASSDNTIKWSSNKTYNWGYKVIEVDTEHSWFYLDGGSNGNLTVYEAANDGWKKWYATSQGMSNYAWLFDYTNDCVSGGCNIEDSSTDGYWTSTPVYGLSDAAWYVDGNGKLDDYSVVDFSDAFGVRPVITL